MKLSAVWARWIGYAFCQFSIREQMSFIFLDHYGEHFHYPDVELVSPSSGEPGCDLDGVSSNWSQCVGQLVRLCYPSSSSTLSLAYDGPLENVLCERVELTFAQRLATYELVHVRRYMVFGRHGNSLWSMGRLMSLDGERFSFWVVLSRDSESWVSLATSDADPVRGGVPDVQM